MAQHDEERPGTTTADFIAKQLKDPIEGEAYFKAYLRAGFLESAVDTLYQARRQAGLTQAQVAEQLHTGQAVIARLEDDTDGAMSLHRYIDFIMACGMIPFNITYAPIDAVRDFTLENPQLPLTQENYYSWRVNREIQSILASQNVQSTLVPNQPLVATATTVWIQPPPKLEEYHYTSHLAGGKSQPIINQELKEAA
jgi:transcriptional regulator with XRE-family HTH domain